ncbi:MAG: M55 family metallopeptidase [Firmicutes bacterium]|nr:M55 family metallopeptidase [Bacillota bacterium]
MKIAVITDMEGVAGILNFEEWTQPGAPYYERGKEFATLEANAAIGGFYEANPDLETVVVDGHGPGGIDPWLLDSRAQLSRGWGVYHQFGLDGRFDAVAWVGQHAKSGALLAHLAHTGSCDVLELKLGGVSMGEFGQCAAIAGFYGTPAIFGSGDRAFTLEAEALTPWIRTVAVKRGVNLTDGADCGADAYRRHTPGATHLHPSRARELIRAGAAQALRDFMANRDNYPPLRIEPPFICETRYRAGHKETRRHGSDIVAMYSAPIETDVR